MRVLKFGGSSLADASRIKNVANVIRYKIDHGNQPRAIVVSALGKMTDHLVL